MKASNECPDINCMFSLSVMMTRFVSSTDISMYFDGELLRHHLHSFEIFLMRLFYILS